jgi:hypothetical protein
VNRDGTETPLPVAERKLAERNLALDASKAATDRVTALEQSNTQAHRTFERRLDDRDHRIDVLERRDPDGKQPG